MLSITGLTIACSVIYYSTHVGCLADKQIIGGTDAPDGMYPYQVSLKDSLNGHFCGGAIVSGNYTYIITAAHCLEGRKNASEIQVGVGSNHLHSQITYTAETLIIHPKYNKEKHLNDIGLIKLSKNITFNENIKSIDLIDDNKDFENVNLTVSGWGRIISIGGPTPVRLQHLNVTGYSQKSCAKLYPDITDGHICTLELTGKGVCNGDSGGALTYGDKLVGIVSFGIPRCTRSYPDVHARVYYYRDWVNKYINAGCNQQLNILLGLFATYLCIHSFL